MNPIKLKFVHGLGDCVNFAHLMQSWICRGHDFVIECEPDKAPVFELAGAKTVLAGQTNFAAHPWDDGNYDHHPNVPGYHWIANKIGNNLRSPLLPELEEDDTTIWAELSSHSLAAQAESYFGEIDASPHLQRILSDLPDGPLVLFHATGHACKPDKDLKPEFVGDFYRRMLDETDAVILILDWEKEMPAINHRRIRHLEKEWDWRPNLADLYKLMVRANLFIGCDSGPLHFLRLTNTPGLGLWRRHYPANYCLPRRRTIHAAARMHDSMNPARRVPFQIMTDPGFMSEGELCPHFVVEMVRRLLEPTVYLDDRVTDTYFRHFISRTNGNTDWGSIADRPRSFGHALKRLRKYNWPTIVETGTVRAAEDWFGGGYSTYLLGLYLHLNGRGELHSVELDPVNADFSKTWTADFSKARTVHCQDSKQFLANWPREKPVQLLYLDSMDLWVDGHTQHCLEEARIALKSTGNRIPTILIDDTMWTPNGWWGKGTLAVPYLQSEGYKVIYSGYQTLLGKD